MGWPAYVEDGSLIGPIESIGEIGFPLIQRLSFGGVDFGTKSRREGGRLVNSLQRIFDSRRKKSIPITAILLDGCKVTRDIVSWFEEEVAKVEVQSLTEG